MLNITKPGDSIMPKNICLLIYSEPGGGKTSIGYTAPAPLLLDFDSSAFRAYGRKDTVQITKWADIEGIQDSDVTGYKTIVIDTIGRFLEVLMVKITDDVPGIERNNMKLYGELKKRALMWIAKMRALGKDIVFTAHDKETDSAGRQFIRPDITGGSYSEIYRVSAAIGYLYYESKGKKVIDFESSERFVAKGPMGLGLVPVPKLEDSPNFLAELIERIKGMIKSLTVSVDEEIAGLIADVGDDPEKLTKLALGARSIKDKTKKDKLRVEIGKVTEGLGLKWIGGAYRKEEEPKEEEPTDDNV